MAEPVITGWVIIIVREKHNIFTRLQLQVAKLLIWATAVFLNADLEEVNAIPIIEDKTNEPTEPTANH